VTKENPEFATMRGRSTKVGEEASRGGFVINDLLPRVLHVRSRGDEIGANRTPDSLWSPRPALGKPYLAVPVSHQFEQIFNAYWLDKSNYGAYWEELNKERVDSFLYNLPHYREALAQYPRQGNGALLAKLDTLIASYTGGYTNCVFTVPT